MHSSILIFLSAITLATGDYAFTPPQDGARGVDAYFDRLGTPDIKVSSKCDSNNRCRPILMDHQGKVLKRFSSNSSVVLEAKARYKSIANAIVLHRYVSGSDRNGNPIYSTDRYIMTNKGKRYSINTEQNRNIALAKILTKSRYLVEVRKDGIYVNGKQTLRTETEFTHAELSNNPSGTVAAVAVDKYGHVYMSDLQVWKESGIVLAQHGDRQGVLAIYPRNKGESVLAIYKYVNRFNKGIVLARMRYVESNGTHGWLYNSKNQNIGFDPEIYMNKGGIYVSAKNSSTKSDVHFVVQSLDISKMPEAILDHTAGFERENNLEFLVGTGVSKLSWDANSKVEKDGVTYLDVKYDISDAIYNIGYLQGRKGNKQLAINYTQNSAEKKGGLAKKSSNFLTFVFDVHGFFSPQSSLRISFEEGNVNGIAESSGLSPEEFETTYSRYSGLVMKERGYYWGLDFTDYTMPSAIGFSDYTKSISYSIFDKEIQIQKLSFVGGYDVLSYTTRYETDMRRFYYAGKLGIGLASIGMSGEARDTVELDTGKTIKSSFGTQTAIALEGELDLGYLIHKSFARLRGLGYSFTAGYKFRGDYFGSTQSESNTSDAALEYDELALEFGRYDFWHGPYITLNMIF